MHSLGPHRCLRPLYGRLVAYILAVSASTLMVAHVAAADTPQSIIGPLPAGQCVDRRPVRNGARPAQNSQRWLAQVVLVFHAAHENAMVAVSNGPSLNSVIIAEPVQECAAWASSGECEDNPEYIGRWCPAACGRCSDAPAVIFEEDSDFGHLYVVDEGNLRHLRFDHWAVRIASGNCSSSKPGYRIVILVLAAQGGPLLCALGR